MKRKHESTLRRIFDRPTPVFHRPHPSPDTDKGAVASIRKWLETNGVKP